MSSAQAQQKGCCSLIRNVPGRDIGVWQLQQQKQLECHFFEIA